jgi:small subunit ribosomal protein S2
MARSGAARGDEKPAAAEPLAEWERELIEQGSGEQPAAEAPAEAPQDEAAPAETAEAEAPAEAPEAEAAPAAEASAEGETEQQA